MSESDSVADGFGLLADKITRETSFRCASYKDKCLRRRIAVRMRARGAESFSAYALVLDSDRREYDRLLDALTVNVTKFFRNPSTFEALATSVVPQLWQGEGSISVWSAGSSSGEEALSLAALFYEHSLALGELDRLARVRVTGSDIDRASLVAAENARYTAAAFADTPAHLLDKLFPLEGDTRTVIEPVRSLVQFERRDILREPPPAGSYDLIACRNVIIYLDREAQEELLCSFHRALRLGGFLVMGRVETLLGKPRQLFGAVDVRERIFRKVR
ncbi:MAG: CheR family methyltransferase [Gemmatimonadaceae bacterium]